MKKLILLLAAGSFILISACQQGESPAGVVDLKCEFQDEPLGIDRAQPLLQWKMKDTRRGAAQTAYQVLVASSPELLADDTGDLWDSGRQESDRSVHVKYEGKPLESGQTCFWKVRLWDQAGKETGWSDPAMWEMGLLNPGDWKASWIARSAENPARSVYLRQTITLPDKEIDKARIFVTGLGNYVFYLNGNRVGNDLLTPGWTHYPKRLEYQVYDVAELLEEGENALGALLGSMWWSGGLGWRGGTKYSEGPLKMIAQLKVDYSDGSSDLFGTDSTWKWKDSPIVYDHIYHGETYDANLEEEGWNEKGYDDSAWLPVEPASYEGVLSGPRFPALREQMQLNAVALTEPLPGEYVFDLGQNMVGWAQFLAHGEKGDTLTLRFAELLHDDGTVAQENLRSAKATDRIICNGEAFVWEPRFTYHGFRYVQVSGLKNKPAQTDLIGKVIHTDEPLVGKFECSNELINRINKNIIWGQRGNFFAVPTDCPQRDERLGWTGDLALFMPTAAYLFDVKDFLRDWLRDLRAEQANGGTVPWTVPDLLKFLDSGPVPINATTAIWGDAAVWIPWTLWQAYGEVKVLEEQWSSIRAHVRAVERLLSPDGVWDAGYQFGDWLDPTAPAENPLQSATDKGLVATACAYRTAVMAAEAAEVLGLQDDHARFLGLAERLRRGFVERYVEHADSTCDTPTAHTLAIVFGLLDEPRRVKAGDRLAELVTKSGYRIQTGLAGTPFILDALAETGHEEEAYRLLLQTAPPSWLYQVTMGATTMWERWDAMLPDGSLNSDSMTSFSHYVFGSVADWMHRRIAGVAPLEPGYAKVLISPQPGGDLSWARTRLATRFGEIAVSWEQSEFGVFDLLACVPEGATARVVLPDGTSSEVGSGEFRFTVNVPDESCRAR